MSLLQMSFAGGTLILAVIVIRALAINLLPKKAFNTLWGISVVRLMIPFSIPSAFSVYSLIGSHAPGNGSQAIRILPIGASGQMASMSGSITNAANTVSTWTVVLFGENAKVDYARALISMEERRSGLTPLCNNFSKNAIEERIIAIMKIKKTTVFSLIMTGLIVVGTATMFATSVNAQPQQAESVGQGSGTEIVTKPDSIPQVDDSYRFAGNYLPILYKNCRLSSLHPKKKEQIKRRDFCTLLAPFLDV